MNIIQVNPLPNVNKFKNKEDFCNRLIQEVITITKKIPSKTNKKIIELNNYKNKLILENENLDKLLQKSYDMKNNINNKIKILVEDNNKIRNKYLDILKPESGGN
jgi:hypothetical protein